MAIETLTSLYHDFRSNFENRPEFTVDFYNRNALLLNNITTFRDKEELQIYIELTSKYLESVYQLKHNNDVIDIVDKKQIIIDKEITRLNAEELKGVWYNYLQFVKGMASYNLKEFKTSTRIFKVLVEIDPKAELYTNWLTHSKFKQKEKYVNAILIFCVAMLLFFTIAGKNIPYLIKQSVLVMGILFATTAVLYQRYLQRSMRRKK